MNVDQKLDLIDNGVRELMGKLSAKDAQIRDLQQALRTERDARIAAEEARDAYKAQLERAEGVIQRLSQNMPGMWLRQEEISPSAEGEG